MSREFRHQKCIEAERSPFMVSGIGVCGADRPEAGDSIGG
jgi:hypothetical protein